ncbi:MAG: type II secretion system protein GspC [Gammaproteobacteria bacterium]
MGFPHALMDVATRILQWKEHPPEEWARAANRYLPHIVSALLIVALASKLAELTWTIIPGTPVDAPAPTVGASAARAGSDAAYLDFSSITGSHLFGEASQSVVAVTETIVDAPDTNLNLELRGTVSFRDSETGWAIIADDRGQDKIYFVDDAIDGGRGTTLHAVYGDRVLLNRAGNLETLRLPKELSSGAPTAAFRPAGPAPVVSPSSLRAVISENASRITNVIRIVPHIEQGQMVGFRLNPGEARGQFDALGLRPGDVVTEINGTSMTDPSRGLQVFEALGETTVASVTVLRNGQPEVLTIDTSQLAVLAEGRQ